MQAGSRPVLLLGATCEPFGVDAAVRRRFDVEIELPFPDESARRQILALALAERQVDHQVPEMVIAMTTGWSAWKLISVARDVCAAAWTASGTIEPDMWIHAIRSRR